MKGVPVWFLAIVSLACIIAGRQAASARETLKYADSYVPSTEAIAQSNAFAIGVEQCEPLKEGWQHRGFKVIIDERGKFCQDYSSSLVVDRAHDPVLQGIIKQARERFGTLPDRQKAEALCRFAHDLFSPEGMDDDELSDWDDSFGNQHRGERLLLGEYILQGKGVCEEKATLLKVLADALGLHATLVFGFDDTTGHVWTTIRIDGKGLIYDPTQGIIAGSPKDAPSHKTPRELYGKDFDRLQEVIKAQRLLENKNYAEAEASLKLIAGIDAKALGTSHPVYAVSLERIADLYREEGKESEAEPYLKKALHVREKAWGPRHQLVADCLNQLANLEHSLGNEKQSERMFKKAISIYENTLGKDDAAVADPLYNLADLYQDEGRYRMAQQLLQRALHIYERSKGPDHPDAVDARDKLKELSTELKMSAAKST